MCKLPTQLIYEQKVEKKTVPKTVTGFATGLGLRDSAAEELQNDNKMLSEWSFRGRKPGKKNQNMVDRCSFQKRIRAVFFHEVFHFLGKSFFVVAMIFVLESRFQSDKRNFRGAKRLIEF